VSLSTTSTMVYQAIFTPGTGTSANSRFGDRTVAKWLNYNLQVKVGTLATTAQVVRLIMFVDYQPNTAVPSTPLPLGSTDVYGVPAVDYRYRFKILRDWLIPVSTQSINPTGVLNADNQNFIQRGRIPMRDLITQYQGSGNDISAVVSGAVIICALADTATNPPTVSGVTRTIFSQ